MSLAHGPPNAAMHARKLLRNFHSPHARGVPDGTPSDLPCHWCRTVLNVVSVFL